MRHRKRVSKLSKKNKHRNAMLRNMATDILKHGRIKTTVVKAKVVRSFVERLITYGKKGTLAARRDALKVLMNNGVENHEIIYKLFNEIAPLYKERNGGYTRILKLDTPRKGDNTELAYIELVDYKKLIVEETEVVE